MAAPNAQSAARDRPSSATPRIRRIAFGVAVASIIALPAWLMFGRALAGAPVGDALLLQAFLGPGLALVIAVVVGVTAARKEVRVPKALTPRDVRLIFPWLGVIALLGLTVIDTQEGRTGSALTAWFGEGWMQASQSFTAIGVLITLVGAPVLAWLQAVQLARETKTRARQFVDRLQAPLIEQRARHEEATFERIDRPQQGRVIRLDDED